VSHRASEDLRRAQRQGAVIRVAAGEHRGRTAVWSPRLRGDRQPWKVKGTNHRVDAASCRAEGARGGPWPVARLLRF
jgi:hypothetical protein